MVGQVALGNYLLFALQAFFCGNVALQQILVCQIFQQKFGRQLSKFFTNFLKLAITSVMQVCSRG